MLINSTSCSSTIWSSLYDKCGNGISEDQWVEKHFSEKAHLPTLFFLITRESRLLTTEIPSYDQLPCESFLLMNFLIGSQMQDFTLKINPLKRAIKKIDSSETPSNLLSEEEIPEEKIQTPMQQIQMLINYSELSTKVWSDLYDKCAQGVQEDSWSENHFHEFLPQLKEILSITLEEATTGFSSDVLDQIFANPPEPIGVLITDLNSVLRTKRLPDPRNADQNNENPLEDCVQS